jgi:dihydroxyacid dehydratase/phosphogluconate dehydratase
MALGRLNRPGIIVYGGTIAPGCHAGKNLDVVSAFEALGQKLSGEINQETFENVILKACPGAGACGGMYTANTMASAIEGRHEFTLQFIKSCCQQKQSRRVCRFGESYKKFTAK